MIEVHRAVLAHQAHVVGRERREAVDQRRVIRLQRLEDREPLLGPLHHPIGVEVGRAHQQRVALLHGQVLVDAARNGAGAMDPLACRDADDLLAELPHQHGLARDLRKRLDDADDVAVRRVRLHPEQQIRRRQMEEVQHVRLEDLPVVHQPPHLVGGGGQRVRPHAADHVHRLGRAQVMAHRTDAAEPLHEHDDFPQRPPLHEPLEAPELDDVETRVEHAMVVVHADGDLAVSLDARQRVDDDLPDHRTRLSQSYLK